MSKNLLTPFDLRRCSVKIYLAVGYGGPALFSAILSVISLSNRDYSGMFLRQDSEWAIVACFLAASTMWAVTVPASEISARSSRSANFIIFRFGCVFQSSCHTHSCHCGSQKKVLSIRNVRLIYSPIMQEECLASDGRPPQPEEHPDVVPPAGPHLAGDPAPSVSSSTIHWSLSQRHHRSLHTEYRGGSRIL